MPRVRRPASRLARDVHFLTERRNRWEGSRASSVASDLTIGRDEDEVEDLTELNIHPDAPEREELLDDGIDHIFDDEVVDLTVGDSERHRLLRSGEHALVSCRLHEESITAGDCIEVADFYIGTYLCQFLLVNIIARTGEGHIVIRGVPLTRTRELRAQLPKKVNEVCQIHRFESDEGQPGAEGEMPLMTTVNAESVVRKRHLIITNAAWPQHSPVRTAFSYIQDTEERTATIEGLGALVCRWVFKTYFAVQGRQAKPQEDAVVRVHANEVLESRYRDTEDTLSNQWRGGRVKGGSWLAGHHAAPPILVIDCDGSELPPTVVREAGQKYTMFDSFSGAGGVSRGAGMAGFKIQYAVDKASDVWQTYTANFPATELFRGSIDQFILRTARRHIRVDLLHLSPPCQYFSPAHTRNSANDDENIFAIFSGHALVEKVRPRIITVEQTFGITHDRHKHYLRALVGDLTQFGYSVRWRVVRLRTWGLAQDRKRLIIIAAAPGERLPPFPRATHAEGRQGGMKPFTTIAQALSGIRVGHNLHDVANARKFNPRKTPYSANRLAGTLTTAGSELYHPDGRREFTLRECASLQGFPRAHRFHGNKTSIKRQIGNAFAPNTVRVLYKHLEQWLLREDGVLAGGSGQDAIMLDAPPVIILDGDSDDSASSRERSVDSVSRSSPAMVEVVEADPVTRSSGRRYNEQFFVDLT